MRFYLLQSKINGIKSIDKEITIDYYNNTVNKEIDIMNNHVKAIYGTNGAGKTGIIYAMEIYKNLCLDSSYLTIVNSNGSLRNFINQNDKLLIENTFSVLKDDNINDGIYKHRIELSYINGQFEITNEYFAKLSGNKINSLDKYNVIYEIKNGEIVELDKKISNHELIVESTKNLLKQKTLLTAIIDAGIFENMDAYFKTKFLYLLVFNISLIIVLNDSDKPYINKERFISLLNQYSKACNDINNDVLFKKLFEKNKLIDNYNKKIKKDELDSYKKLIKNTAEFIKVFKNDLADIEVKEYDNGDYYECENIMVYENGSRVNLRFESTGIKKIIELYDALSRVEKGDIVFIDEFDANLHDVLLMKIVEYILNYSKGQFIFTIHNMAPMDLLQYKKHGIDFLSPDSRIVPWVKNGNYKAASLYRQGYIEYSPFNIEAFSFLGKFGDDN